MGFTLKEQTLELTRELGIPADVFGQIARILNTTPLLERYQVPRGQLTDPAYAEQAWYYLRDTLMPHDPNGMQLLTIYLAAAVATRWRYHDLGIPDLIFIDTMLSLPRMLEESRRYAKEYRFDRGFWVWRHLSGKLFRLGALEFEYRVQDPAEPVPAGLEPNVPVLSVHIPSGANLSSAALKSAYRRAASFFKTYGREVCSGGLPKATLCSSWLLSPALRQLLPENSGIRRFGNDYEIYAVDEKDPSVYLWLFEGIKPPASLPQRTSLQKAVAKYLQSGGVIGCGYGRLLI